MLNNTEFSSVSMESSIVIQIESGLIVSVRTIALTEAALESEPFVFLSHLGSE